MIVDNDGTNPCITCKNLITCKEPNINVHGVPAEL